MDGEIKMATVVGGGWGGFRLPKVEDLTSGAAQLTPVGGVLTGTNIVTKTVAPALGGKSIVSALAIAGTGIGAFLVGRGLGGKQEQQQEQDAVQKAVQETKYLQAPSMTYSPVSTTNTITKNITKTYQTYNAGGDIYGAPVTIYSTPETVVTPIQTAEQPVSGGSPTQGLDQTQEQGQQALSFDMTGLVMIAAVAIGAYFLMGRK